MAVSAGVVNVEPVYKGVPPVATLYQLYVPPGPVAVKVVDEPLQIIAPATDGAAGGGLMITLIFERTLLHPPLFSKK